MTDWPDILRTVGNAKAPRGPGGRRLCRECGVEVRAGRRTFCGDVCVEAWTIRTSPARARALTLARDHGICGLCGFDAIATERILDGLLRCCGRDGADGLADALLRVASAWLLRTGFGSRWERDHLDTVGGPSFFRSFVASVVLWEADHIVPVVEGGGGCGLDGYRTLCRPCHVRETTELRRRRRARRTPLRPLAP